MARCLEAANRFTFPWICGAFGWPEPVVIPIYALTHYYALATMLRRNAGD
jgi:hypothetical protein